MCVCVCVRVCLAAGLVLCEEMTVHINSCRRRKTQRGRARGTYRVQKADTAGNKREQRCAGAPSVS